MNVDDSSNESVIVYEQNVRDSSESSGEVTEPRLTRSGRPRGINAHRQMVQNRGWNVEKSATAASRGSSGRGRSPSSGQSPGRLRGRSLVRSGGQRGRARARGRGLHVQRLQDHSQIVDELIEDDVLFPSTETRPKAVRKPIPTLTKGMHFYTTFFKTIFVSTLIYLNIFLNCS